MDKKCPKILRTQKCLGNTRDFLCGLLPSPTDADQAHRKASRPLMSNPQMAQALTKWRDVWVLIFDCAIRWIGEQAKDAEKRGAEVEHFVGPFNDFESLKKLLQNFDPVDMEAELSQTFAREDFPNLFQDLLKAKIFEATKHCSSLGAMCNTSSSWSSLDPQVMETIDKLPSSWSALADRLQVKLSVAQREVCKLIQEHQEQQFVENDDYRLHDIGTAGITYRDLRTIIDILGLAWSKPVAWVSFMLPEEITVYDYKENPDSGVLVKRTDTLATKLVKKYILKKYRRKKRWINADDFHCAISEADQKKLLDERAGPPIPRRMNLGDRREDLKAEGWCSAKFTMKSSFGHSKNKADNLKALRNIVLMKLHIDRIQSCCELEHRAGIFCWTGKEVMGSSKMSESQKKEKLSPAKIMSLPLMEYNRWPKPPLGLKPKSYGKQKKKYNKPKKKKVPTAWPLV
eukprot:TRINITY_DN100_c0_g1_i1.p1 TRINITY_DN100_c0_g1~~TRINITY_DN100_c0_g1_i1.p1  ORF type:complete len:497 (+),score=143.29 TRINITY_DN100_c0_g1_i1:119-1492(+)